MSSAAGGCGDDDDGGDGDGIWIRLLSYESSSLWLVYGGFMYYD